MSKVFVEGEGLRLQAAMLRLVMERKRGRGESSKALIERVARETGVEPALFEAYLREQDAAAVQALVGRWSTEEKR